MVLKPIWCNNCEDMCLVLGVLDEAHSDAIIGGFFSFFKRENANADQWKITRNDPIWIPLICWKKGNPFVNWSFFNHISNQVLLDIGHEKTDMTIIS